MLIIRRRKTSTDVEYLDFVTSRFGLAQHGGRHVERLNEVLKIRALAAYVKAQALDDQAHLERGHNEVHRLARVAAEF